MKIRPTVGNGEPERGQELHPLCQLAERQAFIALLPDEITGCWPNLGPAPNEATVTASRRMVSKGCHYSPRWHRNNGRRVLRAPQD